MLDRDEDMILTGGRNPFHAQYKVGFTRCGKLTACQMTIYNNAGNSVDLSCSVSYGVTLLYLYANLIFFYLQ